MSARQSLSEQDEPPDEVWRRSVNDEVWRRGVWTKCRAGVGQTLRRLSSSHTLSLTLRRTFGTSRGDSGKSKRRGRERLPHQGERILFSRKNRHFAVSLGCLIRGYTDGIPVKPLKDAIKNDFERMFVPPSVYSRVRRTKHSPIFCGFCEKCSFFVAVA